MIIHLNEHRFGRFFLTESANSKRAHKQTREIIARYLNRSVDDPMVIESEKAFEKEMFGEGLRTDWFITLEPCAAKWVYLQNTNPIVMKRILSYIATKAASVPDRNAFIQQVRNIDESNDLWLFIEKCKKEDRVLAKNNKVEKPVLNQNYNVLGPLTFEQSGKYGNKSGGGLSCKICYTQGESTWNNYSNGGKNKLFILLRKDWETVEPKHDGSEANNGLGEPYNRLNGYDNYGLSMVFVWITPQGEISVSNTRWNHGGNFISPNVDQAFKPHTIEKLMGGTFKDVFNTDSVYEKLDAVEEKIKNGEHELADIVDDYKVIRSYPYYTYLVKVYEKYNLLEGINHKANLVFKDCWADGIYKLNEIGDLYCNFNGGYYVYTVERNLISLNKYINILQERIQNGTDIKKLFQSDDIEIISNNYTAVGFDKSFSDGTRIFLFNILRKDGKFISNRWESDYDCCNASYPNSFMISLGDKQNILKKDGDFLFDVPYDQWYNRITYTATNNGIFVVRRQDSMEAILRQDLSPITNEWYRKITNTIDKDGVCTVSFLDGYLGYVDLQNGNTLGRGFNIVWCENFGKDIKGCGEVGLEIDSDGCYILTKDNELFEYHDYIEH